MNDIEASPVTSQLLATESEQLLLARQGKRVPGLLLALLLGALFVVISSLVGGLTTIAIVGKEAFGPAIEGMPEPSAVVSGIQLAVLLVLSYGPLYLFLALWLSLFEGRPFWTLGFTRSRATAKLARGFLLGLIFFSVAVGILVSTLSVSTESGPPELQGASAVGGILIVLVGWTIQGTGEEILCRGWLLQVVGTRYRPWTGVAVSSLFFGLLHGANPHVNVVGLINIVLVGIFLSLYALREGSIWGVSAWHAAWNWAQGNIFGLEVSGVPSKGGSLLNLKTTANELLTGGGFGPEGGLAVTAVLLTGVVYILATGNPLRNSPATVDRVPATQNPPT